MGSFKLTPFCFVACAIGMVSSYADGDDVSKEIEAANAMFRSAFEERDDAKITALYTNDGMLLPPNSDFVVGRANIRTFWKAAMDEGIVSVRLRTAETELLNDTVLERGEYTLMNAAGMQVDKGKYLVVWKRRGMAWLIHRDCWNSSQPAPSPSK
jgi:uncharacterized protein (TIGR02246 family)